MKAIGVIGYHHTGKTTTVVALLRVLRSRGFSVSSIKDIHSEAYRADKENSNSWLHAAAGSDSVFARGLYDTAQIFPHQLSYSDMLNRLNSDFLVIEGLKTAPVPKIVCAETTGQLDELIDDTTIAISGIIANDITEYKGIRVYCLTKELDELVDTVVQHAFTALPDCDPECCSRCGMSCLELAAAIVQGKATRQQCQLDMDNDLSLQVGDQDIVIVPFVQDILRDLIISFVNNLKGIDPDGDISIRIKR
ncbi:MAG: molybdopterin-guanine dinucleotide biosynthesis protein MobB [Candidatus Cloacimonetes bacterium HGW-Cloacimonetes-1]|jgi:molybdopterin-guanine dinucleotide biosynthesis protein B|nr:MAG: molybdopterin-guanine dinucleotide biosynthesis protein MobB [Candidatus Cloacimonetes bacterium HGW-Cloacimonetes-1]